MPENVSFLERANHPVIGMQARAADVPMASTMASYVRLGDIGHGGVDEAGVRRAVLGCCF